MSRSSIDIHDETGRLMMGFDYEKQSWVKDGKYMKCFHPEDMNCNCYGKEHEGEETVAPTPEVTHSRNVKRIALRTGTGWVYIRHDIATKKCPLDGYALWAGPDNTIYCDHDHSQELLKMYSEKENK